MKKKLLLLLLSFSVSSMQNISAADTDNAETATTITENESVEIGNPENDTEEVIAEEETSVTPDLNEMDEETTFTADSEIEVNTSTDKTTPYSSSETDVSADSNIDEIEEAEISILQAEDAFENNGPEKDSFDLYEDTSIAFNSDYDRQCLYLNSGDDTDKIYDYTGWYLLDETAATSDFYFKNGIALAGIQTIDGTTYYFDKFYGLTGNEDIMPIENGFNVYDYIDEGDIYDYDFSKCKLYYFQKDGTWSNKITGWRNVKNHMGDFGTVYVKNGIVQTGFQTINGKHYFFTDYLVSEHPELNDPVICGELFTNTWFWKSDCFLYYAKSNGELAEGFNTIEGDHYYFWTSTKDGHYSRTMATGWFKVNGFTYYAVPYVRNVGYDNIFEYPDSGVLASGFKTINGKGYYFWPKTENGHYSRTMAKGWFSVNGFKYYANNNGILTTGFKTISGKKYYFWPKTANGHYSKTMAKGWFSLNGFKYYADKNGVLASGWKTINGKKYYFWPKTENGHYANTMVKGKVKINGKWYYFKSNGQKR